MMLSKIWKSITDSYSIPRMLTRVRTRMFSLPFATFGADSRATMKSPNLNDGSTKNWSGTMVVNGREVNLNLTQAQLDRWLLMSPRRQSLRRFR